MELTNDFIARVANSEHGYWVICVESYEYEGKEIPKGRMHRHESKRPIVSNKWRRATDDEINTMQVTNSGNYFNLKNV